MCNGVTNLLCVSAFEPDQEVICFNNIKMGRKVESSRLRVYLEHRLAFYYVKNGEKIYSNLFICSQKPRSMVVVCLLQWQLYELKQCTPPPPHPKCDQVW